MAKNKSKRKITNTFNGDKSLYEILLKIMLHDFDDYLGDKKESRGEKS